jgi:hypothetical protein
MTGSARRHLNEYFAAPNRELESLLGITLDEWPT